MPPSLLVQACLVIPLFYLRFTPRRVLWIFKHAQRDKSLMRGLKIQAHVLIRELYIVKLLLFWYVHINLHSNDMSPRPSSI
jgi:hypothetical protein